MLVASGMAGSVSCNTYGRRRIQEVPLPVLWVMRRFLSLQLQLGAALPFADGSGRF